MRAIWGVIGALVALAVVVAVLTSLAPATPASAQNTACYMERGGLRWVCRDTGTFSNAGRTLYPGTALTVTTGTYTPTVTLWPVQSAAVVTLTLGTGTSGQLLIVHNVGAQTVNLVDSGNAKLTAAAALGQDDTLTLLYNSNWVELARANN